jgi:membrane dipeptidase
MNQQRRLVLRASGLAALAFGFPSGVFAQTPARIFLGDAHNHFGMVNRMKLRTSLKSQMEASGVTLVAWSFVSDGKWIRMGPMGVDQVSVPGDGEVATYFRESMEKMRGYLAGKELPYVQTVADVDAAVDGKPFIVLAAEAADFLEGKLDPLEPAHGLGLRHLQLVHYMKSALGDLQTAMPAHKGLSEFGLQAVKECNRLGILVDLAHCTAEGVDQAVDASSVPCIWSHSYIADTPGDWRQSAVISRRLGLAQAKSIAAKGGAVGLWGLARTVPSLDRYASELLRMADLIGPQHVMFGTDVDGLGSGALIDDFGDLRKVVDILLKRGVEETVVRGICIENYARCLKGAMRERVAMAGGKVSV